MITRRDVANVPYSAVLITFLLAACAAPAATSPASSPSGGSSVAPSAAPSATSQLEAAPAFKHKFTTMVSAGDPWDIAVADLNADGKPDLVTGTSFPQGIVILFGHGDGTFGEGPDLAAGPTKFVKAADLNGDGSLDLVAAGDTIAVLVGNGDGTFQSSVSYAAGQDLGDPMLDILGVAIDDLNGDAIPDLIAANWVGSQLAVLIGRGDGSFDPATDYACGHCDAVALGDLDGDGDPDVVATAFKPGSGGNLFVFRNDGNGVLAAPLESNPQGNTVAVLLADLNVDGNLDVVTGNDGSHTTSVLLGNGDGTFSEAHTHAAGNCHAVVVVDLDGDGRLDILAGGAEENKVWFYRSAGEGTFARTQDIPLMPEVSPFFAVADLNADQRLDLAIYNGGSRSVVSVLLGE